MRTISRIAKIFSYLSFEVALGGLSVGMYFWNFWGSQPLPYWDWILLTGILSVYNLDHLIDASKDVDFSDNPRRFFFRENRLPILSFVIFTSIIAILLAILYLPNLYIGIGLGLFVVVLIFFYFGYKRILLSKEFLTAWIYTLGVLFIPFLESIHNSGNSILGGSLLVFVFFLAAFQNLLTNAYLDSHEDEKEGFSNLTHHITPSNFRFLIIGLGAVGFLLYAILLFVWGGRWVEAFAFLVVFILPIFIVLRNKDFTIVPFRSLGEWSFVLFFIAGLGK